MTFMCRQHPNLWCCILVQKSVTKTRAILTSLPRNDQKTPSTLFGRWEKGNSHVGPGRCSLRHLQECINPASLSVPKFTKDIEQTHYPRVVTWKSAVDCGQILGQWWILSWFQKRFAKILAICVLFLPCFSKEYLFGFSACCSAEKWNAFFCSAKDVFKKQQQLPFVRGAKVILGFPALFVLHVSPAPDPRVMDEANQISTPLHNIVIEVFKG